MFINNFIVNTVEQKDFDIAYYNLDCSHNGRYNYGLHEIRGNISCITIIINLNDSLVSNYVHGCCKIIIYVLRGVIIFCFHF